MTTGGKSAPLVRFRGRARVRICTHPTPPKLGPPSACTHQLEGLVRALRHHAQRLPGAQLAAADHVPPRGLVLLHSFGLRRAEQQLLPGQRALGVHHLLGRAGCGGRGGGGRVRRRGAAQGACGMRLGALQPRNRHAAAAGAGAAPRRRLADSAAVQAPARPPSTGRRPAAARQTCRARAGSSAPAPPPAPTPASCPTWPAPARAPAPGAPSSGAWPCAARCGSSDGGVGGPNAQCCGKGRCATPRR